MCQRLACNNCGGWNRPSKLSLPGTGDDTARQRNKSRRSGEASLHGKGDMNAYAMVNTAKSKSSQ